jgi:hypothetical protein
MLSVLSRGLREKSDEEGHRVGTLDVTGWRPCLGDGGCHAMTRVYRTALCTFPFLQLQRCALAGSGWVLDRRRRGCSSSSSRPASRPIRVSPEAASRHARTTHTSCASISVRVPRKVLPGTATTAPSLVYTSCCWNGTPHNFGTKNSKLVTIMSRAESRF